MDLAQDQDAVNKMTQDVFNLLTRSVNKDFMLLGYPTILLTKKSGRDFVSLCALMNNCSALLASVKSRSDQAAAAAAIDPSASKSGSKSSSQQKKGRSGGLFSSAKSNLKLQIASEVTMLEGIAERVKRDTEEVIETTRCLPEPADPAAGTSGCGDQLQSLQAPDRQLIVFFATRWVQFKDSVTRKLLEAGQLAVEVQSLRSGLPRSKSVSGDGGAAPTDSSLRRRDARSRQRSLSRPPEGYVSVTKIPSLEAEIRRLKLELNRREQRHKDELDRQAKDRERLSRDFRLAQRRIPGPRWPAVALHPAASQLQPLSPQLHQQLQAQAQVQSPLQQQNSNDTYDQVVADVCQMLDRLVDCLGGQQPQVQLLRAELDKRPQHHLQNNLQAYVDSVCNSAQIRIAELQADCSASRRRQADLEVLISILKARLDLTNDQVTDLAKFEAAVSEIAKKLAFSVDTCATVPHHFDALPATAVPTGDEPRDSLVSRLTSRLRERQRPQ